MLTRACSSSSSSSSSNLMCLTECFFKLVGLISDIHPGRKQQNSGGGRKSYSNSTKKNGMYWTWTTLWLSSRPFILSTERWVCWQQIEASYWCQGQYWPHIKKPLCSVVFNESLAKYRCKVILVFTPIFENALVPPLALSSSSKHRQVTALF